ncbi:MAG: response regulator [Candidatus Brevundimonas colombiensis]|uniref:Response regulator n=1 Tax=Candidatus Brevundimonas colombiensis TaxID=3121376 RepID=A0AAJ5X3A4_9CAUL|nr:response regulator [Brevundimonas sp.]WEK39480.1 MAG: response regulator [Brevundimonas sp.]
MSALALVVEDEIDIAEILDRYLKREGFRTARAGDGQNALELHTLLRPDVVLLDVGLPRQDGWAVLSEIRRTSDTPVIMMTALDQDIDKLQALRMGADDYVVKPFNPSELVARAQAILRRSMGGNVNRVLRIGPLEIDPRGYLASVVQEGGTVKLSLSLTEFRLLEFMARQPLRVFSRSELVDACLPGEDVLDRTVDSHMFNLRRKLRTAGAPDMINGVRGVGYRMDAR